MSTLNWFFTFVLALGAFLLGRYWTSRNASIQPGVRPVGTSLPEVYLQGLNYLLNEHSDQAIDAFIDILATHPETAETHLTLGRLFRKRGELERAIRVHKNLLEQEKVESGFRYQALLELGWDYLKAGILDRAEAIFREAQANNRSDKTPLYALADIYELEQDWKSAIEVRRRLTEVGDGQAGMIVALLYCELAEEALNKHQLQEASTYLSQAYDVDPQSPRGTLLAGKLAMAAGRCEQALDLWEALLENKPGHFSLILDDFLHCAESTSQPGLKDKVLYHLAGHAEEPYLINRIAKILAQEENTDIALAYLRHNLEQEPQLLGMKTYVNIASESMSFNQDTCNTLAGFIRRIPAEQAFFHCTACGFHSQTHYWKCPGCRRWDTFEPILETPPHV